MIPLPCSTERIIDSLMRLSQVCCLLDGRVTARINFCPPPFILYIAFSTTPPPPFSLMCLMKSHETRVLFWIEGTTRSSIICKKVQASALEKTSSHWEIFEKKHFHFLIFKVFMYTNCCTFLAFFKTLCFVQYILYSNGSRNTSLNHDRGILNSTAQTPVQTSCFHYLI